MTTSKATREYWINIFKGWAETRLSPPQADEAIAVLDEMMEESDTLKDAHDWRKEQSEKANDKYWYEDKNA
jgi:hypothetical protein